MCVYMWRYGDAAHITQWRSERSKRRNKYITAASEAVWRSPSLCCKFLSLSHPGPFIDYFILYFTVERILFADRWKHHCNNEQKQHKTHNSTKYCGIKLVVFYSWQVAINTLVLCAKITCFSANMNDFHINLKAFEKQECEVNIAGNQALSKVQETQNVFCEKAL